MKFWLLEVRLSTVLVLQFDYNNCNHTCTVFQRYQFGSIEGDFALCISLYHAYELLNLHGLRSFFNFLDGLVTGEKGYGRTKTELQKSVDFNQIYDQLKGKFATRLQ